MTTFRIGYGEIVRAITPFLLLMIFVLLIVTYIPAIALVLL
jgi:TRAP-type C4-dicarboxylate transport system permease large subunit